MSKLPSHKSEGQDPEAAEPNKNNDHVILGARHSSTSTSFDVDNIEEGDIEDGLIKERDGRKRQRDWAGFWRTMTVRSRRKGSLDVVYEDVPEEDGLLHNTNIQGRTRRRSIWYNCYIFGGISGLAILIILLAANLLLTIARFFSPSDIYTSLPNWAQPGSGKEGLAWYPADFTRDIVPIPCHSHNDYWRKAPLVSAILTGCIGVESDVWLFDNELYVGHNTASLMRNRTFESLYVNPLVKILEQRNTKTDFFNGMTEGVFDEHPGQTLTLLVDLKSGGAETWPWVVKQLQPLRERGWLSFIENGKVHRRPITVVGSGNAPFDLLTENTTYRDTFFDAPLDKMWEGVNTAPGTRGSPTKGKITIPSADTRDIGQGLSRTTPNSQFTKLNSYYASASFKSAVGKISGGKLNKKQINIIQGQVRGAHRRGLKARYWDTPAWPLGLRNHVWDVLIREGVDLLNVDDLRAASEVVW